MLKWSWYVLVAQGLESQKLGNVGLALDSMEKPQESKGLGMLVVDVP